MKLFFTAFRFLTIVPVPGGDGTVGDLGRSMRWFPAAGLLIGLILLTADYGLSFILPDGVIDLLLVVLLLILSGALHVDGVADVCDGLAARGGRERMLEVMKDPRCGAAGAASVAALLLLKYVALSYVPMEQRSGALLLFPLLSRFAQVQMTVGSRRARADGLGALFIAGVGWKELTFAALFAGGFSFILFSFTGLYVFSGVCLLVWGLKRWLHGRLSGITGDVIGFASELAEVATLLLIVALFPAEADGAAGGLLDI